ncbi:hypothetical protein WISP_26093 [Willisornis vidua]|uniref:Reverse transcriptase domain-containing protein n=1 Tax=Willisornis vidua TaxID=1566151 RepID=A0ABQ9DR64_9PASS|nr:hypothetical protein WISP_26093 [Willisornis vidua]
MDISDEYCTQGSILGPVLFNIFTNDTDRGIKCTPSKFADDTKLTRAVDTPEGQGPVESKFKKWAHWNLMWFNKTKRELLLLGQGNPQYEYRIRCEQFESSPDEKKLEMVVGERLDTSQQCARAAQKSSCILDCIKSSVARR